MKTDEPKKTGDGDEKPKTVKNTALDLQRMKLEKLMKNPVSDAIAKLAQQYIALPQNEQDKAETRRKFHSISRFPSCIGALDCTHVRIISPGGEDAEIYRNRKSFFSINVQTTADPDLRITNIVARWPGSAHDSTIFNNSTLKRQVMMLGNDVILGDSGYPLLRNLITKIPSPTTRTENLFNQSQIRTRNVVERSYGVWKRRFPVLSNGLREKPVVIPDRQKDKKTPHVPDFVRNVMGSSAGAGSGEFHVYRHLRRKEYARQKAIGEKGDKASLDEAFQMKLLENQKQAEDRTAKKRAKRLKKKLNLKKKKIENAKAGVKMTDPPSDTSSSEDSDCEEPEKDGGSGSNTAESNPNTHSSPPRTMNDVDNS